jgi:hypothetical protein
MLQLRAEELMLPKVSCQNLIEAFLRLAGSGYLVCPEGFFESQKASSSQIEVLKSRGFSGSFCCLGGVVASFVWIDGVFNSWCCVWKLDVGVDL